MRFFAVLFSVLCVVAMAICLAADYRPDLLGQAVDQVNAWSHELSWTVALQEVGPVYKTYGSLAVLVCVFFLFLLAWRGWSRPISTQVQMTDPDPDPGDEVDDDDEEEPKFDVAAYVGRVRSIQGLCRSTLARFKASNWEELAKSTGTTLEDLDQLEEEIREIKDEEENVLTLARRAEVRFGDVKNELESLEVATNKLPGLIKAWQDLAGRAKVAEESARIFTTLDNSSSTLNQEVAKLYQGDTLATALRVELTLASIKNQLDAIEAGRNGTKLGDLIARLEKELAAVSARVAQAKQAEERVDLLGNQARELEGAIPGNGRRIS